MLSRAERRVSLKPVALVLMLVVGQSCLGGAVAAAPALLPGQTLSGAAAVESLTSRGKVGVAERIARQWGMENEQQLLDTLRSDPSLSLDPARERLVWADPPVDQQPAGQDASGQHDLQPNLQPQQPPQVVIARVQRPAGEGDGRAGVSGSSSRPGAVGAVSDQQQQQSSVVQLAAAATRLDPELLLSEALSLHSRPSAYWRIVLDFTGYNYTSNSYFANYHFGEPIPVTPYSIDDDATTFSDEERRRIIATWFHVSEDWIM